MDSIKPPEKQPLYNPTHVLSARTYPTESALQLKTLLSYPHQRRFPNILAPSHLPGRYNTGMPHQVDYPPLA